MLGEAHGPEGLLDYAERMARAEIATWPKGTYRFTDHIDSDGMSDDPVPLTVAVTVRGDGTLQVDWTGSSKQVKAAINSTLSFTKSNTFLSVRCALKGDIPNNAGVFRCIEVTAPEGSVLNPIAPAPVAARALTGYRVIDTMFGALAQIVPHVVPAAGEGGNTVVCLGGRHPDNRPFIIVDMISGCWGGDRWGRRSTVLGGLAGFGAASLMASLAPNLEVLLIARILQGVAGAFLATNSLALAYEIVPVENRGKVLGRMNVAIVLAAAAGPLLGGRLIGQAGWRAIFWLNLPLVSISFLLGWFAIPNAQKPQRQPSLDLNGLVPLFRERTFSCANGVILLMYLAMYLVMLAVPIWMANQTGWTSTQTVLALAVMTILLAVCSPVGGGRPVAALKQTEHQPRPM